MAQRYARYTPEIMVGSHVDKTLPLEQGAYVDRLVVPVLQQ